MNTVTRFLFATVALAVAPLNASAQTYNWTTLAGKPGGAGNGDGPTATARFNYPAATATDDDGNIYVADARNYTVRVISPGGEVSTLAGKAGEQGSVDGQGAAARFGWIYAMARGADGNLYLATDNAIRKVSPTGAVSTLAGNQSFSGAADGNGAQARFSYPRGLAVSANGTVYVADGSLAIREVSPTGAVRTLAGKFWASGAADGTGVDVRFSSLNAITFAADNSLVVVDGATVRRVTLDGTVTTIAGKYGSFGSIDGPALDARFDWPTSVVSIPNGAIVVADSSGTILRLIDGNSTVSSLVGSRFQYGIADGTASAVRLSGAQGLSVDLNGDIIVADSWNDVVRRVTIAGLVTTEAGQAANFGFKTGVGEQARLGSVGAVTVDGVTGNIFVGGYGFEGVAQITPSGNVTTTKVTGGFHGKALLRDATGNMFSQPAYSSGMVLQFDVNGVSRTFSGVGWGSRDGSATLARFGEIGGLARDAAGNIYVTDTQGTVRRISRTGMVTTLAGQAGSYGNRDGSSALARFNWSPDGIAVDRQGNLYIADTYSHTIRRISPTLAVTTFAGQAGTPGSADGVGNNARFRFPRGVAVDAVGNVYVADQGNHVIRRISPGRVVTTIGGTAGIVGGAAGVGGSAQFSAPRGIAIDAQNRLYVTDSNNRVAVGSPVSAIAVPGLGITTLSLPTATVDVNYSQALSATGGIPGYIWRVVSGLPKGMRLSGNTLTGRTKEAGTFSVVVEVKDGRGVTARRTMRLKVALTSVPPAITTTSLPEGISGEAYTATITAAGGDVPYAWSLRGRLPVGLGLKNGVISGSPQSPGTFSFAVVVTGDNDRAAQRTFSIKVAPPTPPTITTTSLIDATEGENYAATLVATGGAVPYAFQLSSGSGTLPPGLRVNAAGSVVGVPTTPGKYDFTVQVIGRNGASSNRTFSLQVQRAPVAPTITTTNLARAVAESSFSEVLRATDGAPPYDWSLVAGELPAGLSLDAEGKISGTPEAGGTSVFTVEVSGANGKSSRRELTIVVDPKPVPPVIGTLSLSPGQEEAGYSQALTASGGTTPYAWSVAFGALPPGVQLTTEGALAGTPTAAGNYTFTVRATGANGLASTRDLLLTIRPKPVPVSITTSALAAGTVNAAYRQSLAATGGETVAGTRSYSWSIVGGSLPTGLTLASSGVVSGTPSKAMTRAVTMRVRGANGTTADRAFNVTINEEPLPPTITSTRNLTWTQEQAQSFAATASGGSIPYTWSVSANLLPPGLSFTSGGILSGIPSVPGTSTLPITVTGSDGLSSTTNITVTIRPKPVAPTIQTTAVPVAVPGVPYSFGFVGTGGKPPYGWAVISGALPTGLNLDAGGQLSGNVSAGNGTSFTVQVSGADGLSSNRSFTLSIAKPAPPSSDDVFASDYLTRSVLRISTVSGNRTTLVNSAQFQGYPNGLAMDGNQTLYVIDTDFQGKSRILKVNSANGQLIGTITNPALTRGYFIAIDETGNLYVNQDTAPYILKLAPDGTLLKRRDAEVLNTKSELRFTTGIGLGPDGRIYVCIGGSDFNGGADIVRFTKDLEFVDTFVDNAGNSNGFRRPIWDASGNLFVANLNDGNVKQFSPSGTLLRTLPAVGGGPVGLAFAPNGDALVGTVWSQTLFRVKADGSSPATTLAPNVQLNDILPRPNLPEAPAITTSLLEDGVVEMPYGATFAATGGTAPYDFAVTSGNLPVGFSLSNAGVLSGSTNSPAPYIFGVTVTGANGLSSNKTFTLNVKPKPQPPTITTAGIPSAVEGTAITPLTFDAGGTGPFKWALVGGALPPGIAFEPSGAVLSGTPSVLGEWTFTLRVTDSNGLSTDASFVFVAEAKPGTFPPPWYSQKLVTFPEDSSSISVQGVSSSGRAIGSYYIPDPTWVPDPNWTPAFDGDSQSAPDLKRAFVWSDGALLELLPTGATESSATDINGQGQVVGTYVIPTAGNQTVSRGFVWRDGVFTDILPPGAVSSDAEAINDAGQVVGSSTDAKGVKTAYVWKDGVFTKLLPAGTVVSYGADISTDGYVLGGAYDNNGAARTFLWKDGGYSQVAVPGARSVSGYAVGTGGKVVGAYIDNAFVAHAFLSENGTFTSLEPTGATASGAFAITANGLVAGSFTTSTGAEKAFLWKDGTFLSLDTRVANTINLTGASALSESGLVVATGTNSDGDENIYLLKPESTPKPALPIVKPSAVALTTKADSVVIRGTVSNSVTKVVYRMVGGPDVDPDDYDNLAAGTGSWSFEIDTVDLGVYRLDVYAEGPGGRSAPTRVTVTRQ